MSVKHTHMRNKKTKRAKLTHPYMFFKPPKSLFSGKIYLFYLKDFSKKWHCLCYNLRTESGLKEKKIQKYTFHR